MKHVLRMVVLFLFFLHGLAGDLVVFGRGSANDCSGRDVRF